MANLLILFVGCVIGFICNGVFINWHILQNTFYNEIKATDIAQLVITVFFGLYITNYINTKTSNNQKQKDIIINQTDQLLSLIKTIYKKTCDYMHNPEAQKEQEILHKFKNANIVLDQIINKLKIKKFNLSSSGECLSLYFKFKEHVTDSPFKSNKPAFDEYRVEKIYDSYVKLFCTLDNIKFSIYS